MKIYDSSDKEMMDVREIAREGDELVIRGKIFGAMPMAAKLRPQDAREALRMMDAKTAWFFLTLPFRKAR